ncbi:diguanylate cyclase domain-containing protein [Pontibacillus litoralis]|uniref:Diguanylate cyclase n=1 Tax=Pontibacillus litoralis JSM 072002 TaxID=1385512 RepID=A0A0A5G7B3_9BACI|nr:diguanylate cyclase [Pontibacillus litoralis]KGX87048.1 diguanylate cyclase [Pontibacillus litoralis JSM 072002]
MVIDLISTITIIVAFLFIAGRFFENRPLSHKSAISTKIYAGIGSGLLGSLLMVHTIAVTHTIIVDVRQISIIVAVIYGGPISAFIASLIISFVRVIYYGFSTAAFISICILFSMTFLLPLVIKHITTRLYQFITASTLFTIVNIGAIYLLTADNPKAQFPLIYYLFITVISTALSYYMAEYIKQMNVNNRHIRYYKYIADNAMDLISSHYEDGTFKYVSPSSKRITGYTANDLIGKPLNYFLHPDDVENNITPIQDDLHSSVVYRFRHLNGEYIWLETNVKRVNTIGMEMEDILCFSRDQTKRIQLEQEIGEKNKKLKYLSNMDWLTKVANKRYFNHKLRHLWEDAHRNKQPVSLILFDIDYFKLYNDHYGHLQGDQCLQQVAEIAKQTIRIDDFLARFGGEEFTVLLPNTNEYEGKNVAESICSAVEKAALVHDYSPVSSVVTISVGISTITPSKDVDSKYLINNADKALYKAKAAGRNTVRCFQEEHIKCEKP